MDVESHLYLKIFLFQTQFKLTKRESAGCLEFVRLFSYLCKSMDNLFVFMRCSIQRFPSHKGFDKVQFNIKVISATALKAIGRHLLYLGE